MNSVVEPTRFYGRAVELQTVAKNAECCVVVVGGSRIGKTSLLARLGHALRQGAHGGKAHTVPLSGNAMRLTSAEDFSRVLLKEAKRSVGASKSRTVAPDLVSELASLSRSAAGAVRIDGIVFLIDEADRLLGQPWSDAVFATIQHLVDGDHQARNLVGFVLAGLRRFHEYREDRGSRLHGKSLPVYLGPLDERSAERLLQEESTRIAKKLTPTMRADLLASGGGHPFLLKGLLHLLKGKHLAQAEETFLEQYGSVIRDWWRGPGGLTEKERSTYRVIAAAPVGSEPASSTGLVVSGLSPNERREAVRTLHWMGLIRASGKGYVLGSQLIRRFVEEERAPDPTHWDDTPRGWENAPSLVSYHDPAVRAAVDSPEALRLLREAVTDSQTASFGGHGDSRYPPEHQAEALYRYLRGRPINYRAAPPRWIRNGQEVRPASDVLHDGKATCLDLALAYAAMLEAVGLRPVLFLVRGHALVGLWKLSVANDAVVKTDWHAVADILAQKAILPIDIVQCSDMSKTFDSAVRSGRRRVNERDFESMIDIRAARERGIEPVV